ncbi:MAG: hypothetical protein NT062_35135 [Proteobacteria bacterium]|nr:hypothetical protein [Pseudomonadota bacterium]
MSVDADDGDASPDDAADELDGDRGKRLRAVWLAMADEDPPERGMAALMAAATKQAHVMVPPPPSLWGRLVELLRRPPVLALATVVVLVGGAVLVHRHEDTMVAHEQTTAPVTITRTAPGLLPPAPLEAAAPSPPTPIAHGAATAAPDPSPRSAAKGGQPSRERAGVETPPKPERAANVEQDVPPPPPPPPPRPVIGATITTDGEAEDQPTASKAPVLQASPTKSTLTADQLLAQCQSAAMRGDCHAARDLATRISTTHPALYRERVLKNATIAKCLEAL